MELEAEAEKLRKENHELLKNQVSNNVITFAFTYANVTKNTSTFASLILFHDNFLMIDRQKLCRKCKPNW